MGCLHEFLSLRTQENPLEENTDWMADAKETRPSKHSRTNTHELTETVVACTVPTCVISVPKKWTQPSCLIQKLYLIDNSCE
ncbi:rCG63200, partial [Rattus norvegicus]